MAVLTPRSGIENMGGHMAALPELPGSEPVIKLASNENALGPSYLAIEAAQQETERMHWYPEDRGTLPLQEAIGARHGLDPARIVVGPGSDELLTRLIRGYLREGDELIFSRRGYAKFRNYAHSVGAIPVPADDKDFTADVDQMLASVTPKTRVVMIANPDNPTSTHVPGAAIRCLHAGLPEDVLLVLDSAYAEYVTADDYEDPVQLVNEAGNVVMTRTFSKIHGLAGLRLGWTYAGEAIVDTMRRLSATFPVSGVAIAAGVAALDDFHHIENVKTHTDHWREEAARTLNAAGLRVLPSQTNFVLIDFSNASVTADTAEERLLGKRILVRRLTAPGLESCLRMTIGMEYEMELALDELRALMGQ